LIAAGKKYDDEVLKVQADGLQKQYDLKKSDDDKKKKDQEKAKQEADKSLQEQKQRAQEAMKVNEELRKSNQLAGKEGQEADIVKVEQDYQEKLAILQKAGASEIELELWKANQIAVIREKYRKEEQKNIKDAWEAEKEARVQAITEKDDLDKAELEKRKAAQQKQVDGIIQAAGELIANDQMSYAEREGMLSTSEASLLANTKLTEDQRTSIETAFTQARIELAEQESKAKAGAYQAIGGALTQLSDLIGKQTVAGKALGIATAGINTWVGVTEVLKTKSILPEPLATISRIANIATVVASGLGAIKNIMKVQVPGASGGAGATPSLPAALAPLTPQAGTTALDQASINAIGNSAANRTFVLDSDVQNNRERATRLARAARLG
jgi:hypothetical protein